MSEKQKTAKTKSLNKNSFQIFVSMLKTYSIVNDYRRSNHG